MSGRVRWNHGLPERTGQRANTDFRQPEHAGEGGSQPTRREGAGKSYPGGHDMYENEGTYEKFTGSSGNRMFMTMNNLPIRVGAGTPKRGN